MLTKQLQVLIDTSLANGQSYDEIRGMLSLQKFSDSDITGMFAEYDALVDASIPKTASEPVSQKVPVGMEEIPKVPPLRSASTAAATPTNATAINLDDGDDISFVEEEAAESAEYNVKTPSYLDKEEYDAQAANASAVSSTIAKPVEKEVFDIDEDFEEDVAIPVVPTAEPQAPPTQAPVATPPPVAEPQIPNTSPAQEPAFSSPAVPVNNNVPLQSRPQVQTSHVAAQPDVSTDNLTQFGSTLTSSSVGAEFTGKNEVNEAIAKSTAETAPPQLGGYEPAMQHKASPTPQQQAPVPAAVPPTYQPSQPQVQVGLGGIPELSAATQFAQQQERGKGIGPLIIILVIVLGIIFGFMYWYYFISDLRSVPETSATDTEVTEPVVEVERDPFTGQPI